MNHLMIAYCVIACVVIYTIFSIVLKLGRRRHLFKLASKFPGPSTLPFIGNAHLFIGNTEDIMNRFFQLRRSYSTTYRIWFGDYLTLCINTPEQFKVVLLSPKTADKGELYDFVEPWLGKGLVTASATKWREHRRIIQPTFSPTIIQSFVKIFAVRSAIMAEEMERNLDGPEFDIYNYTSQCALRTVCETTMGVKLGADTNNDGLYAEAVAKVVESVCRRVVSPWLHPNFIFYHTSLGKSQQKYIKFLHAFTDNVIQRKKEERFEQSRRPDLTADNEEDTDSWIPRKKILLEHLIEVSQENKNFSDEAIREEVDTMMVAGSDTTAVTISYAMLMLASHPEVQEKVYQELWEIYHDEDSENRHVIWEDMSRMTYLERVIRETMRLFPVSPTVTRLVTDNLDVGEQTFPAGSLVILSIIDLHRNGDVWPDPLKFDPDRFLPDEIKKRDSYAYLPFGGGPRSCIGSKYAMNSMKTLLATILRRYVLKKDNITPVKDLRLKWEFILRPVDPIKLRVQRRQRCREL